MLMVKMKNAIICDTTAKLCEGKKRVLEAQVGYATKRTGNMKSELEKDKIKKKRPRPTPRLRVRVKSKARKRCRLGFSCAHE